MFLALVVAGISITVGLICLFATDVAWELQRLTNPQNRMVRRTMGWEVQVRLAGAAALAFGSVLLWALLSGSLSF